MAGSSWLDRSPKLFFFGVGRGAYTARTLAGILHLSGLIRRGSEALIPYAIRIAAKLDNETFEAAREFTETFSIECPVLQTLLNALAVAISSADEPEIPAPAGASECVSIVQPCGWAQG